MNQVTSTLRRTPLAARHLELGARMVDFGGWEMPLHYGSQMEEHHAVRRGAGMFDVSHMCVVDVLGEDARGFLRFVLANNVDKLKTPGKALYTCMLGPEGGILDDLIVYYFSDTCFRLIVNAATAHKDLDWLAQQAKTAGAAVTMTPRRFGEDGVGDQALAIIAVQGPQARERTWQVLPGAREVAESLKPFNAVGFSDPELGEIMIARTGYTGEDGHELIVAASRAVALWDRLLGVGVQPAGLGARDTLRLEAGMNLYGQDMDERVSPLDCGLKWTLDLESPRDFVGKAALMRQEAQWQMTGLIALGRTGMLRAGQIVVTPAGEGRITSGTFSPTIQQSIALARLPLAVAPGEEVSVLVRDKPVRVRVVPLPFVRNGQIRIQTEN